MHCTASTILAPERWPLRLRCCSLLLSVQFKPVAGSAAALTLKAIKSTVSLKQRTKFHCCRPATQVHRKHAPGCAATQQTLDTNKLHPNICPLWPAVHVEHEALMNYKSITGQLGMKAAQHTFKHICYCALLQYNSQYWCSIHLRRRTAKHATCSVLHHASWRLDQGGREHHHRHSVTG